MKPEELSIGDAICVCDEYFKVLAIDTDCSSQLVVKIQEIEDDLSTEKDFVFVWRPIEGEDYTNFKIVKHASKAIRSL